jgi:hypothetical protein
LHGLACATFGEQLFDILIENSRAKDETIQFQFDERVFTPLA